MAREKILMVDDDEMNLTVAELVLAELGYAVTTAADGDTAIRLLLASRFDLLLLSSTLNYNKGLDTLTRIREISEIRNIRTILLTESVRRTDMTEALRLGVLKFLDKPLMPETLIAGVKEVLLVGKKDSILAVDDDEMNLFGIRELFGIRYDVRCASSGADALEEIRKSRPDLVLLDFHMPGMDGLEVLQRLRDIEGCENLPVVFLTSDTDADTEAVLFRAGAMDFIAKPFVVQVAMQRLRRILDLKHLQDSLHEEVERKTAAIRESNQKLKSLSNQIIRALTKAVDAKDHYTNGHSDRVAEYAREIARRMGKNPSETAEIYNIALLHDIGKIGVPTALINKPARLTDPEYELIKSHAMKGYEILRNISEMPALSIGARWHHERYDGSGYPDGKSGEDIPEVARIICVADCYDAMSSDRSYRTALPQSLIREEFLQNKGSQFDPRIADIMVQMIDEDKDYEMTGSKKIEAAGASMKED